MMWSLIKTFFMLMTSHLTAAFSLRTPIDLMFDHEKKA